MLDWIKKHKIQLALLLPVILVVVLFSFRKSIFNNKYAKVKINIFKKIQEGKYDEASYKLDSILNAMHQDTFETDSLTKTRK